MTLREEFESLLERGTTFNDGDYVVWLLNRMADAEFTMGEADKFEVVNGAYDVLLDRSDAISTEILSFFPAPAVASYKQPTDTPPQ